MNTNMKFDIYKKKILITGGAVGWFIFNKILIKGKQITCLDIDEKKAIFH